jgi:hypothetical protein
MIRWLKACFTVLGPWHYFFLAFITSLILRFVVLSFANDAKLGWDENLYLRHANALIDFFSTGDVSTFYKDYFQVSNHVVRFFPPASPIGYALFSFFSENTIFGARIYNSLLISLGIASATTIFWFLTKNIILSLIFLGLSNLSLTHNAYSLFLWTEGAQFGLVSFILCLSLFGCFNARKVWVVGLLLTWLNMTHGSSLFFSAAIIVYLFFFKLPDSLRERFLALIWFILPSLLAVVAWGVITKPVIGEFVVVTSETIPMKSLQNPPSSYMETWKSIREKSEKDMLSLSEASSQIAWEYIEEKGIHFLVDRGYLNLKNALVADVFPKRHMDHAKWPFLDSSTFQVLLRLHYVFYFVVYFGLALYFFQNAGSKIMFLLGSILALKIASIFFTGIGITRYFSSFYMIVFPFSFLGILVAFKELWKNEHRSRVLQQFAWALFFATVTI